jgi:Aldo/keto reductases, related to diketogulonate reductase
MNGIRVIAHSPLSAPGLLTEPVLQTIADTHDVSPAAIAISYHVDRGVIPIPSSTTAKHISANLAAANIQLSDEERNRLQTLADTEFER